MQQEQHGDGAPRAAVSADKMRASQLASNARSYACGWLWGYLRMLKKVHWASLAYTAAGHAAAALPTMRGRPCTWHALAFTITRSCCVHP